MYTTNIVLTCIHILCQHDWVDVLYKAQYT